MQAETDVHITIFSLCWCLTLLYFCGYDSTLRGSSTAAPTSSSTRGTSSSRATATCPGVCPRPRATRTPIPPRLRLGSLASSRNTAGASWTAPRWSSPRWASSPRSCSNVTRAGVARTGQTPRTTWTPRCWTRTRTWTSPSRTSWKAPRSSPPGARTSTSRRRTPRREGRIRGGETNDTTTDARHPGETFLMIRPTFTVAHLKILVQVR